ncbi:MAG TPA: pseudouridine synthase [Chloroflexota bacterium]|nr:pseudouridine synthase [Chloroflexota bacterium]
MVKERLQKILAAAGVASRRAAEQLIDSGRVTVNGGVARIGDRADLESDEIAVDGRPVRRPVQLYIALNKPRGYVTSLRSTHGEPTVDALVDVGTRVFPVGRLDRETSGLLLLTNDGEWANMIAHPRHGIEKEYRAVVRGTPSREAIAAMERGVRLPDGTLTRPASVRVISNSRNDTLVGITLLEGKKRQIRLMASAVGYPVLTLERTRIGPVKLNNLPLGTWRFLSREEVAELAPHENQAVKAGV